MKDFHYAHTLQSVSFPDEHYTGQTEDLQVRVMNPGIIVDCIIIIGCAALGFVPFDKKRVRAGWAKLAYGIIAVIGIARGTVRLAWELGWFTLGTVGSYRLDATLYQVDGVILGFLFSLILSGQLTGTKRDL